MGGMIQPIAGPLGPYDDYIRQVSEQYGLDPNMLHSLIQNESGMNPNAVSPRGAMGLGQLMPGTAQDLGVTDPFNPAQNIGGTGKYLGNMLNMFHGDPQLGLAAYNAGPGNVQKFGGIPPFQETQNYVQNVMRDAQPPQAPMAAMASPSPDFGMNPMQDMPPMPPQYAPSKSFAPGASPTLESSFNGGAKLAPGAISAEEFNAAPAGAASSIGDFFKSAPGLASTGAALLNTDFEDPHSIGANAGAVAGGAIGTSVGGPIGGAVGSAAGSFLGDTIGGLFGDSSEEKAQKEAKKKKEEQYLLASMRRTSDMMRQGQLDRRQAMDNITRYLQQTNAA